MNSRLMVLLENTHRAAELLRSAAPLAQALSLKLCAVHVLSLQPELRLRTVEDYPFGHCGVACLDAPPQLPAKVVLERIVVEAPDEVHGIFQAMSHLETGLLLMGTHGREGMRRMLEGSVAEAVVRRSPCPVLLLREGVPAPLVPPGHLLVPIAPEGGDERAVVSAVRLALALGAQLTLLHVRVHTAATYGVAYGAYPDPNEQEYFAAWRLEGEKRLEAVRAYARALGGEALRLETATLETFESSVAGKILHFAGEQGVDLIALSTASKRGLERLLLGSVAEGVVHHAQIPVLLLGPHSSALEPEGVWAAQTPLTS